MHVLLLTDRDWTHPQGGRAGTDLLEQVTRWLEWGHRVTVVAGRHRGAEEVSRPHPALAIHRMGSDLTVFGRAALASRRGLGADADVVLEVVDGRAFLTPLWWWLKAPAVTLVHQVDGGHHVAGPGSRGPVAAFLLERVPLTLYRRRPFLTGSDAARRDLVALGVPPGHIHVTSQGELSPLPPAPEADAPALPRLGRPTAAGRAGGSTGDAAARASLDVLERTAAAGRQGAREVLAGSDTGTAAVLAGATLLNNAIQLAFTVAITRVLGVEGYGALAALVSTFLVLLVGGQSVQAAAAREAALGRLGGHGELRGTLARWTRSLLALTAGAAALGAALREPLAALIGVEEHAWAAAAVLPTGGLWLLLSLQRGALQGLHAFRPVALSLVGEAGSRLVLGLALGLAGAGVTGVFLATPLCFVAVSLGLGAVLARRLGPARPPAGGRGRSLRSLATEGWVPIVGLLLLAVLQNADVIVARHELGEDRAGSYAVAAVAAKVVVWVAIGVGLQLLPQATARAARGEDPRPVLVRALAVLAVIAAPSLLVFALVPELVLRTAFGPETVDAAGALPVLGLAMTLLAVAYLTVQYMLALGEVRFLWVLAVVAVAEILLLFGGSPSLTGFAAVVLGAQVIAAGAVLVLGLRARPALAGPATP